jgi:hypothetical protein
MYHFRQIILDNYNIDIFTSGGPKTTASLALRVLELKYPNDYKNIPAINLYQPELYKFIRRTLYGGLTAAYIPFGKNLYHYDANSFYPYSALRDLPSSSYIHYIYNKPQLCKNINYIPYGFHHASIVTPENDPLPFGLLPFRNNENILIYPKGTFSGY